jgi:hypothetical protein
VALAVAAALVLGALTLRMSGHYLPLATIAWGLALNYTMANMEWLGKYDGILGIPTLSCSASTWAPAAACTRWCGRWRCWRRWGCLHLLDSRPGRAIRALKNGSTMAEAMGISTFRYKLTVFVLAALAGRRVGLAVRALPAQREPLAVRHQQGHRVPVHGGARRRRPCLGRLPRLGRGAPDRGPTAGAAAQAAWAPAATSRPSSSASCWWWC